MINRGMTDVLISMTVKTGNNVGAAHVCRDDRLHPYITCRVRRTRRVVTDAADIRIGRRLIMTRYDVCPALRLADVTQVTGRAR